MQLGRENRKNGKGGEKKQQKQKAVSIFQQHAVVTGKQLYGTLPCHTYPLSRATRTYPLPNTVLYPYHHMFFFFGRLVTWPSPTHECISRELHMPWIYKKKFNVLKCPFVVLLEFSLGLRGDHWSHVNWALLWLWLNFLEN